MTKDGLKGEIVFYTGGASGATLLHREKFAGNLGMSGRTTPLLISENSKITYTMTKIHNTIRIGIGFIASRYGWFP